MEIYKKLLNVQLKLNVPKSHVNKFGGYNYRNCEDIVDAVKPLLSEEGLVLTISDELVLIGDRYYIKATVTVIDIETGDKIEVNGYAREEENKKGMDSMQLSGATGSYARKYALNGMFAIDDTKDSDTTNKHGKGNNNGDEIDNPLHYKLNFGKNKGKTLAEVDTGYLKYLSEKASDNSVKQAAKEVLKMKNVDKQKELLKLTGNDEELIKLVTDDLERLNLKSANELPFNQYLGLVKLIKAKKETAATLEIDEKEIDNMPAPGK